MIYLLPLFLALRLPGRAVTRHVIAVGQMLTPALFIHLTGGGFETHFFIFGALASLASYRDVWILASATVVVAGDHFLAASGFRRWWTAIRISAVELGRVHRLGFV